MAISPSSTQQQRQSQTSLLLRRALEHDCRPINKLIQDIHAEYNLSMDYDGRDGDLKQIIMHYPPLKNGFWVYENEAGQVVGTGAIQQKSISTAELKRFYLTPAYRSGGHGRRMMAFLIEFCRQSGYKRIVLESHTSQEKAIRFYRTYGFTETAIYSEGVPIEYTDIAFELALH